MRPLLPSLLVPLALIGGCSTRVIVEQPKPLEININFTGHLNLVIHDARQNLEQITGEKPTNIVRPEDIGLPPAPRSGTQGPADLSSLAEADLEPPTFPILWSTRPHRAPAFYEIQQQSEQDLTRAMAARNARLQALWAEGIVGESHTGLLVAKGTLNDEQQQLLNAENRDRSALYALEADRKKVKPDEVALGYYVARLGYAKKGAWYEVRNAATSQWEWKRWGQ